MKSKSKFKKILACLLALGILGMIIYLLLRYGGIL